MPANEIEKPTDSPSVAAIAAEPGSSTAPPEATQRTLAQVFVEQYEAATEADNYAGIDFYEGDADEFDPEELNAEVLADVRWSADYGMPSWDGWWKLIGFPDGSAVTVRGGDDDSDPEVENLPTDERSGPGPLRTGVTSTHRLPHYSSNHWIPPARSPTRRARSGNLRSPPRRHMFMYRGPGDSDP